MSKRSFSTSCEVTKTAQRKMLASEREFQISENDLKDFLHLADLLHLFHHRNKNQHRHGVWYRHFSIFRREVSRFTQDLTNLNTTATTHVGRTKKKNQDAQSVIRTHQRLEFWKGVMVARWQHAFSQVIADGRFAVLGLVLTAVLARVCQVVSITADLETLGQAEVERVLNEFGRKERDWDQGTPMTKPVEGDAEDHGEVIARKLEEDVLSAMPEVMETTNTPNELNVGIEVTSIKKRTSDSVGKPKKKRKKNGDAIDDIFG